MRACASHPWRVVVAWLGIIAGLVLLVATVGGSLKDQFEIPGSDTQRATDLIESEFASEQGGVLNLVFAAPEGERLDTPERKAAIAVAIAKVNTAEFAATAPRIKALKAVTLSLSPSRMSIARRVLPSRLELNSFLGSSSEAPRAKVSFTTCLYVSPVQTMPS